MHITVEGKEIQFKGAGNWWLEKTVMDANDYVFSSTESTTAEAV